MEGNKGRLRKMHGLVKSQFNMSCVILQPLIIMFQANENCEEEVGHVGRAFARWSVELVGCTNTVWSSLACDARDVFIKRTVLCVVIGGSGSLEDDSAGLIRYMVRLYMDSHLGSMAMR